MYRLEKFDNILSCNMSSKHQSGVLEEHGPSVNDLHQRTDPSHQYTHEMNFCFDIRLTDFSLNRCSRAKKRNLIIATKIITRNTSKIAQMIPILIPALNPKIYE